MLIKPNTAKLDLQVTQLTRSPDGWGSHGRGKILDASKAPKGQDFIQAGKGDEIAFFVADNDLVSVGGRYDAEATLIADERGGQIVLRSVRSKKS